MAKEQLAHFEDLNINSDTTSDSAKAIADFPIAINKIGSQNEDGKKISVIENLVKDLVKRKYDLKTVQKFLKTKDVKKEYGIKKTPDTETIETIFNDAKEKAGEEDKKALLKLFVKISTYSEELKPDKLKNNEEYRGTEMGEPTYYQTKNSNKTWTIVSSILQDLLKQGSNNDQNFVEQCKKFIETADTKYHLSTFGEYPSKNTTSEQLNAIKTIINIVITNLIKYGGKNIMAECKTILNNLDGQKKDLEKTESSLQNITDEKINKKIEAIKEEIKHIEETQNFINKQLKAKKTDEEKNIKIYQG